jgi:hypothetical protein
MFYTAINEISIRNYIIFDQFYIEWYNFVLCMIYRMWINDDDDDDEITLT